MKPSNYIIRIPEPCHEDWSAMKPDEKGKFCNVCTKSVHDFSNKTDAEITKILLENKDQKICGHFKKTQVNRSITISFNLNDLPKNVSATKAFVIAAFLVFGSMLFSCTNEQGKTVGEITIEKTIQKTDKTEENYLVGEIAALPVAQVATVEPVALTGEIELEYKPELHMAGGMSIEYYPIDTPKVITPTVAIIEEPLEPIQGLIMVVHPEGKDTVLPQVLDSNNADRIIIKEEITVADKNPIENFREFIVYPNPSKGEFTIKYNLSKPSDVLVYMHNAAGALVKTIVDIKMQYQGNYQIPVNSSELPNGIYIVTLIHNGTRNTQKVIIEK